jgi:hypothetical protein
VQRLGGCSRNPATTKPLTASTNQPKNSEPDHAPGLQSGRMREQPGRPRHHKSIKTSEESNHSSEASGATPDGCARAHPPEQSVTEKGRSPRKKVRQSLQASANTPFEAQGLLSGTIIRGTPNTPKHGCNHHQYKLQRLMGVVQVKASSTQVARSRLARAQPRAGIVTLDEVTSRPRASSGSGRTLGTPEAQLEQASSRSNLGQIASPTDRIAGAFNARIA